MHTLYCSYTFSDYLRPPLPPPQAELTRQQNEFKIKLKELEDALLSRLASAGGNFLGDTALVENLETTKRTAAEIEKKVEEALVTEKKINEAREHYRPASARAALLYFILNDLEKINPLYQFSLKVCHQLCIVRMQIYLCTHVAHTTFFMYTYMQMRVCKRVYSPMYYSLLANASHYPLCPQAFSVVFHNAIDRAEKSDDVKQRVINLIDSITYLVFLYTSRGLFEADKLIFTSQVTFQVGVV